MLEKLFGKRSTGIVWIVTASILLLLLAGFVASYLLSETIDLYSLVGYAVFIGFALILITLPAFVQKKFKLYIPPFIQTGLCVYALLYLVNDLLPSPETNGEFALVQINFLPAVGGFFLCAAIFSVVYSLLRARADRKQRRLASWTVTLVAFVVTTLLLLLINLPSLFITLPPFSHGATDLTSALINAAGYEFGAQQVGGSDRMDQAISQIVEQVGQDISYYNYDDVFQLTQDLYNGNVEAIIYNTAYNASLEEQFEGFSQNVRELESVEIRTEVQAVAGDNKDVTKNAFTVFISGIDTEGSIATVSRSDVNMLVTVNPKTKQILMTSIPRDYFVELPGVSEGQRDKLTHAGLYGVDCSMNTLESLFGVEINYYARVNFTTLRDIVNALGGVDLDSRYEFTTISGEYFTQGMNYDVDGSSALAFARERKNLPGGDNARVLNQQTVLKAILNKCMSPAILTGYMGIMESLSNSFETNLSQSQISSLVRMQLSDGAAWNIVSSAVVGTDSKDYCYSSGDEILYVMEPDYGSVETAAGFMDRVLNGETITQEEVSAAEGL